MLITVTIDVRDLDPGGPPPERAAVTFARLTPTDSDGVLVTTSAVQVPLTGGHGTVQLTAGTAYLVRCYGIRGYSTPFAVLTGSGATTLAQLWRTGQIDPGDFQTLPVSQSLQDLLAEQTASVAATYPAMRSTEPSTAERAAGVVAYIDKSVVPPILKGWSGSAWVALGGSAAAAVSTADNGNGTFTVTGSGVTDNGDGTFTITDPTVVANADGTYSLAA